MMSQLVSRDPIAPLVPVDCGPTVVYTGVPNCQYKPDGVGEVGKLLYTVIDNTNKEL